MKKIIVRVVALIIVFTISFSDAGFMTTTKAAGKASAEVKRAIAYGFVPKEIQGSYNKVITYKQYTKMITNMMGKCGKSYKKKWKKISSKASKSNKKMTREDGILETSYALVLLGNKEYLGEDWDYVKKIQSAQDKSKDKLKNKYPQFPSWKKKVYSWSNSNYIWGGITMCAVTKSKVSGKAIYPYKVSTKTASLSKKLTRKDAIQAVLRLAETQPVFYEKVPTVKGMSYTKSNSWKKTFLAKSESRKNSIINSKSSVSGLGNSYYVSNSGNDSNDGKSPDKAWASLEHLKEQHFVSGDCIYFECGGIWRGSLGYYGNNITISSYGSGQKPRIYGSPENGIGEEKWSLFSKTGNARIWQYNGSITECAGIVFNDGESVAKRVIPWYDGKKNYDSKKNTSAFNIKTQLSKDLSFYCQFNYSSGGMPYVPEMNMQPEAIYLRCDNGNPGKLFKSIEFISKPVTEDVGLLVMEEGCTVDNLCFMYIAGTAVSMTQHDGLTVKNCEFGYCGNIIEKFVKPEDGAPGIWTDGNAVQIIGSNCVIENNYLHDIEGGGIVFEIGGDISGRIPFSGTIISGNLIDKCGDPIYIRDNGEDSKNSTVYGDIKIIDNYVMNTGYGWYEDNISYINPSDYNGHSKNALNIYGKFTNAGKNAEIINNVFYRSTKALIYMNPCTDIPVLSKNVFAQEYGGSVINSYKFNFRTTTAEETKSGLDSFYKNAGTIYILKR